MVKKDSSYIVKVTIERKETSSGLIGPDFDLVVVSAGHEKRLCLMEIHPSYRAVMFFKAINQRAHPIVP